MEREWRQDGMGKQVISRDVIQRHSKGSECVRNMYAEEQEWGQYTNWKRGIRTHPSNLSDHLPELVSLAKAYFSPCVPTV